MRRYETIAIIDPDLPDDDRTALLTRIKEIVPQHDGVLIAEDLWGSKKLAYEIKKKSRGYYARFDYCGEGPLVDELERFFRIDDRVMKYLTVQLDPDADVEKIQAEMTAAQASEAPEAPETPEATEAKEPAAQDTTAADPSQPPEESENLETQSANSKEE